MQGEEAFQGKGPVWEEWWREQAEEEDGDLLFEICRKRAEGGRLGGNDSLSIRGNNTVYVREKNLAPPSHNAAPTPPPSVQSSS